MSLTNYLDAGAIVAGASGLTLWQNYLGLSEVHLGWLNFISANCLGAAIGAIIGGFLALMLLLLLYYGIFARAGLTPITVAVFTFALNVSAHVAELLRSALEAADKGQAEAARTLGFSAWSTFRLVTLPQVLRIAKPVYQSTIVTLIQWTTVVGYVTITDLTRVINNTASRTMQPLLTIIIGMLIYLALSYIIFGLFALSDKIKDRRRRAAV